MSKNKSNHRRSSFWQITIPAVVGAMLIVRVGVWVVLQAGGGDITRWSEISTVLLVIPVLFLSLFPAAVLVALIVLVGKIHGAIPPLTGRVLGFLQTVQEKIKQITGLLVQPVIRPSALLGGVREILTGKKSKFEIE